MDDAGLLAAYVESPGSSRGQEAFRALIDRHVNMVYAVCRRQLKDEHWAEDVSQAVFVLFAKKATELPQGPGGVVVGGWLYKTAVYACSNARQLQRTRSYHESRVKPMIDSDPDNPVERAEMEGILDEGLMQLSEEQREVLVLRFFENKPLTEVARLRGKTMYATEKAHTTGLTKLKKFLAKRGVTATGALMVSVLAQQAAYMAPAGLAAACHAVALGTTAASATVAELVASIARHAARMKLFAGAGVAAGCLLLATTVISAGVAFPTSAGPSRSPAVRPAISEPAVSPRQQALEIAALEKTLQKVERALRDMDPAGLAEVVTFTNLRQAKQWEAMARVFEADQRLKEAAYTKFGDESAGLTSIKTFGERLDEVLPTVDAASIQWRITEHSAVLRFTYTQGAGGGAGGVLYFVRDSAQLPWKLDAGRSLDIALEGVTPGGTRRSFDGLDESGQSVVMEKLDRLERAFSTTRQQIADGKIASVPAAKSALERAAGDDGRAFFHLALRFDESEQARLIQ
jgi:RNA polymerase sigma factor (sigma-70 family)